MIEGNWFGELSPGTKKRKVFAALIFIFPIFIRSWFPMDRYDAAQEFKERIKCFFRAPMVKVSYSSALRVCVNAGIPASVHVCV